MPVPYVTFPGVSGNYISTPDNNLLDADTAHVQQSIGSWIPHRNFTFDALQADPAASFGDNVVHYTITATGADAVLKSGEGGRRTPVTPNVEYSYSVRVKSDVANATFQIQTIYYDAASGGTLGTVNNSDLGTAITGGWQTLNMTYTATGAGDLFVEIRVYIVGAVASTDLWLDVALIAEGSDPTFRPSLRISSSLDMRTKIAASSWANGADQYVFGRYPADASLRAYLIRIRATGIIRASSVQAANGVHVEGTPAPALVAGSAHEIRYTMDHTTGNQEVFLDAVSIGTATPGVFTPQLGDWVLEHGGGLGSTPGTLNLFTGDMYWTEVRDGIDGPIVARFDAEDVPV